MKISHTCPKCQSDDITRVVSDPQRRRADRIPVGNVFNNIAVTRYLCGNCGYSEEWVDSPEDIERVRAKYG